MLNITTIRLVSTIPLLPCNSVLRQKEKRRKKERIKKQRNGSIFLKFLCNIMIDNLWISLHVLRSYSLPNSPRPTAPTLWPFPPKKGGGGGVGKERKEKGEKVGKMGRRKKDQFLVAIYLLEHGQTSGGQLLKENWVLPHMLSDLKIWNAEWKWNIRRAFFWKQNHQIEECRTGLQGLRVLFSHANHIIWPLYVGALLGSRQPSVDHVNS